jgi:hypothetical protein
MSNVRSAASHTHTYCRSLLQKAVRRGNLQAAIAIAEHLVDKNVGDGAWLNQRAAIMAFEECPQAWGQMVLAENESTGQVKWSRPQAIDLIVKVAAGAKWKQATGLGTLAYFAHKDPRTIDSHDGALTPHIVEVVRRIDLLEKGASLASLAPSGGAGQIQLAANTFATRQAWPWDKAFMISASYLAEHGWGPNYVAADTELECPVWVGLDRHTELGKLAITAVAESNGIHRKIVEWTGFYFESAVLNSEAPDRCGDIDWWYEEKAWRLGLLGVSPAEGSQLWASFRHEVQAKIELIARTELQHLERVVETRPNALRPPTAPKQSGLWND